MTSKCIESILAGLYQRKVDTAYHKKEKKMGGGDVPVFVIKNALRDDRKPTDSICFLPPPSLWSIEDKKKTVSRGRKHFERNKKTFDCFSPFDGQ